MTRAQSLVKLLAFFSPGTGSSLARKPGFAGAVVERGVIYAGNVWGSFHY